MADHVTLQVLDAVLTAVTGLTTTGTRVYQMRPEDRALQADEMPALLVFLGAEEVVPVTLDGTLIQRTTHINIGVRVKGIGQIDETVDIIRKEVETVMAATFTVGGKVGVLFDYTGMAEPELDADN